MIAVLISANTEWQVVRSFFPAAVAEPTPLGDSFETTLVVNGQPETARFFHGGWGKIAAAASSSGI
jgi:adenosylhomocysteine nucleosidase